MGKVPIVRSYIYRMTILPTLYFFSLFYLALSCAWKIDFGNSMEHQDMLSTRCSPGVQ